MIKDAFFDDPSFPGCGLVLLDPPTGGVPCFLKICEQLVAGTDV
jgi:hypothetical protein